MTKIEFLAAVAGELSGLSPADSKEQIGFLSEMLDDRIEEGLSEAAAVAAMGTPTDVAAAIIADAPFSTIVEESAPPKGRSVLRTALLCVSSPIWVSLLFAAVITLFCVIVTFGAVGLSLGIVALPSWFLAKHLYAYSIAGAKILLRLVACPPRR